MLGSPSEADDAVREAWLGLVRSGADGVENLGGWLTTVVARGVCLNMLRSRRSRREESLEGPLGEPSSARVPDPIVGRRGGRLGGV
jgi:RNA polymerase sigma-70 factor (ECF subfamily)